QEASGRRDKAFARTRAKIFCVADLVEDIVGAEVVEYDDIGLGRCPKQAHPNEQSYSYPSVPKHSRSPSPNVVTLRLMRICLARIVPVEIPSEACLRAGGSEPKSGCALSLAKTVLAKV